MLVIACLLLPFLSLPKKWPHYKCSSWADYIHRSVKITAKLWSLIGDSGCAVKITDRWFQR